MSDHPVLVRGAMGAVLGMSVNTALILGLPIHNVVVAFCVAIAVGILSGLVICALMPDVY